jgi:hypothetical protein
MASCFISIFVAMGTPIKALPVRGKMPRQFRRR